MHINVDVIKITRLHGSWYYLSQLSLGHINLNINTHEALVYREQPIQDTEIIEVTESGH